MSRTKKGSKPPTYEYWGKRALSCIPPSKYVKKLTHKLERLISKKIAKKELKDVE